MSKFAIHETAMLIRKLKGTPDKDWAEAIKPVFAELERERMRLAACGVAAMSNTPETIAKRINADSDYFSASYSDVCRAVDREDAARAEAHSLREALRGCGDERVDGLWHLDDCRIGTRNYGSETGEEHEHCSPRCLAARELLEQ